jgi:hypothetical protein
VVLGKKSANTTGAPEFFAGPTCSTFCTETVMKRARALVFSGLYPDRPRRDLHCIERCGTALNTVFPVFSNSFNFFRTFVPKIILFLLSFNYITLTPLNPDYAAAKFGMDAVRITS